MLLSLIRRDPTLRVFGRWLTATAVAGVLLLNGVVFSMFYRGMGSYREALIALYLSTIFYLMIGQTGMRSTQLDLTLPISMRRIWISHLVTIIASSTIAYSVMIAFTLLVTHWLNNSSDGPFFPRMEFLQAGIFLYGAILLGLVILSNLQPEVRVVKLGRRSNFMMLLLILTLGAVAYALSMFPLPVALVLPSVAAFLVWRQMRNLPDTLSEAPRQLTEEQEFLPDSETLEPQNRSFLSRHWRLFKTIATSTSKHPSAPWIGLPFLLAFGLFLSGLMGYWRGWGGMQFNFIALTSYSIFAISGGPVAKYFLFDGMPISRRRLFAILVLPGLAILTLGYGAGRIGLALLESRHEVIVYGMEEDSYGLRLPLHLWEIDWKGETPRVEALSGENPAVKSLPIATAGGPRLYKPYTTHESSSPQFVAEQLRRALLLHCGESPPVEELRDRYFRLDENGKTVLKGSTLTVFEDYPELKLRPEWGTFPYIFTLTGLWFFLALWIYFRFFMAEVGEGRRKGAFVSILVIMLLMHMIPFFTFMFDWIDDDTFVAMQQILIRDVATAFPGSILLVWLVGGLLFAGAYRLCERQFQKVELPSDDSASCMMNL